VVPLSHHEVNLQGEPDVAITTDIIVGFPGETEQDFTDSLHLIRQANFDSVNTLMFSPRPQTTAATMPNQIDEATKNQRLQQMMELVEKQAQAKNQKLVGAKLEVLVEGEGQDGKLSGRTRGNKLVCFEGSKEMICKIVPVKITLAQSWVLEGTPAFH